MKNIVGMALLLLLLGCHSNPQPAAFDKGFAAYREGRYAEANNLFTCCIHRKERTRSSFFYKGQCLSALNDYDSLPTAVDALSRVYFTGTATDNANEQELTWKAAYGLGDLYYRLERYPEALRFFLAAYRLHPTEGGVGFDYNLGICLLALDRPREATRHLRCEGQRGAASAQTFATLAEAYLLCNNLDSARFFLQKTLRLDAAYAPALALQEELDSLAKKQ